MNEYVILRVYERENNFVYYQGSLKQVSSRWEMVEFRHYKDTVRFGYYVDNVFKSEMKFEDMQKQLKKDGQNLFEVNYETLVAPPYTLLVQGIDTSKSIIIAKSLYEIRSYGDNVYKKYRRDEESDMTPTQALREKNSVDEDLKEIKEREEWAKKLRSGGSIEAGEVIEYLEKCWALIDNTKRFKEENDELRRQGLGTRIVGVWNKDNGKQKEKKSTEHTLQETENNEENAERRRWRIKSFTAVEVIDYLAELWMQIDKLRSFKYENEYMKGRGFVAAFLDFRGQKLSDLLIELKEI